MYYTIQYYTILYYTICTRSLTYHPFSVAALTAPSSRPHASPPLWPDPRPGCPARPGTLSHRPDGSHRAQESTKHRYISMNSNRI